MRIYLLLFLVPIIALNACKSAKTEFTENGIYYKFHERGEGKKADTTDFVSYHYKVYNHLDSLLQNTWEREPITAEVRKPQFKGSLDEIHYHFMAGDSLTVKVKADSVFRDRPIPEYLESGKDIRFEISVLSVKTKEERDKEIEAEKQAAEAERKAMMKKYEDKIDAYLAEKGLKAKKTESGLYYIITEETEGRKPNPNEMISVHYKGTLLEDGKMFDNSYDRGKPLQFAVGRRMVIPGWDEGLLLLNEGEKATLIIPPYLAYGEKGAGDVIPPNAILRFDVELVEIFDPEKQKIKDDEMIQEYIKENNLKAKKLESGVYYIQKQKGTGKAAESGKNVSVHYEGRLLDDGTKFDASTDRGQPFEFTLGKGQVIPGWDQGIALMKVGEKGTLLIPSHLAYGTRGAGRSIPPNAVLRFDVELLDVKE